MRLLVNPGSGRSDRAPRLIDVALAEHGIVAERPATLDALRAALIAARDGGDERVIVAGGDGTLHQAVRVLAGSDCALGIVPAGTGNDLASALGIPADPEAALRHAVEAPPRRIDLGAVDGIPYAGVLGVGIDADVNAFVDRHRGRLPRGALYAAGVLASLWRFRPSEIRIEGDDEFEGEVMLAAVANGPCFGGGMRIAPAARLDDGRLDLVVVEPFSRLRMATMLPRVYRGTHVGHPRVRTSSVRELRLSSARTATLYADGEPIATVGPRGVRIAVRPAALSVAA